MQLVASNTTRRDVVDGGRDSHGDGRRRRRRRGEHARAGGRDLGRDGGGLAAALGQLGGDGNNAGVDVSLAGRIIGFVEADSVEGARGQRRDGRGRGASRGKRVVVVSSVAISTTVWVPVSVGVVVSVMAATAVADVVTTPAVVLRCS